MGSTAMGQAVAKKPKQEKPRPGFLVRLPHEFRAPLEARAAVTGRTVTAELTIAVVKHLTTAPEAAALMKLPDELPTGHGPTEA